MSIEIDKFDKRLNPVKWFQHILGRGTMKWNPIITDGLH